MMDGTFVERFANQMSTPAKQTVRGKERLLVPAGWSDATPKMPSVAALRIGTLTGLVDYLKANRDGLDMTGVTVHVVNPNRVDVQGPLDDEDREFRRHIYLTATTDLVGECPLKWGQWYDAETFIIGLQAGFDTHGQRDELVMLMSAVRESDVRETFDNGVAQTVQTAGGVVLVGEKKVPNPVLLAPFRTFREITQPVSSFVLRLKKNPQGDKPLAALFEADGGTWKLEAIRKITGELTETLANADASVPVLG